MGRQARMNPNHMIQTAPARVRDSVGRILELGDEVLVLTNKFPMRIASITPLLDQPGIPPGQMKVILVARVTLVVPRDAAAEDVYFTRHQAEIGDNAIKLGEGEGAEAGGGDEAD